MSSHPLESLPHSPANEPWQIEFPHAEVVLKAYLRRYHSEDERAEKIKIVLYEFLREEIENIKVFTSEEGVQFPYTAMRVNELARRILEIYKVAPLPAQEDPSAQKSMKQEFVFTTALSLAEGDPFHFVEEAMARCIKYLPAALKALQGGEELKDREIITLGMPTNTFGSIPPEFAEKLGNDLYGEMGKIYAELIRFLGLQEPKKIRSIELFGISLAANTAIKTGERLIEEGIVTQDWATARENDLPYLKIRTEVPVALSPSKIKAFQVRIGFLLNYLLYERRLAEIKANKKGKPLFDIALREALEQRGILEQMSAVQRNIKSQIVHQIILRESGRTLKPKPETKVTAIYGGRDLTTWTPNMLRQELRRKMSEVRSLGQNLLDRRTPPIRNFAVKMPHVIPRILPNELHRMQKLGEALEHLESSGQ